jgi:hypothetical protein
MPLLRLIVAFLLIFVLFVTVLPFTPGEEVAITRFANPNLIGFARIDFDLKDKGIKAWVETGFEDFWIHQQKYLTKFPKPALKLIHTIQRYAILKMLPYYTGAFLYTATESEKPIILYVLNSRINPLFFRLISFPISIIGRDRHNISVMTNQFEVESKKYHVFKFNRRLVMFFQNLCLISDTIAAFRYAFSDTHPVFSANLLTMESLLSPESDFMLILDNRLKTFRLATKYFATRKLSFDTEIEMEFYQSLIQKFKIHSDSIIVTGLEADILDGDMIKGKWLIVVNNEKSARQLAGVVDGLHQVFSQELGNKDLIYSVERNLKHNMIISDFKISGFKKLTRF